MTRRPFVACLTLVTSLTLTTVPASATPETVAFPRSAFPLGKATAPSKTRTNVARGVSLYTVHAGRSTDGYTVTLLMPNGRDHGTREDADAAATAARAAGLRPVVRSVIKPAVADAPAREYFSVHIGSWSVRHSGRSARVLKKLKKARIRAKVDYRGDNGIKTTGPWNLRVLTVDSRAFRGSYAAGLGKSVAKRETTSSMARRAIAAVNGGFFNIHTLPALRGEPVGVSVVAGRLLSEAVPGRSALILQGRTARVTELTTTVTAASQDGAQAEIQGVNRNAAPDELVLYTEEWGAKTPADDGADAVIDRNSRIVALRTPGAAIPAGHRVLHGSGTAATWLWEHAWENWTLALTTTITDLRTNQPLPLTPDLHIIGGGVGLLQDGRIHITAKQDGHNSVNMILRRHPRTLAGVTPNGSLILATVDGRAPGVTIGANMTEAAQIMRWLGAVQAINLDGGGSTTMVVKHKVVNKPSDGHERPVGDALLLLP